MRTCARWPPRSAAAPRRGRRPPSWRRRWASWRWRAAPRRQVRGASRGGAMLRGCHMLLLRATCASLSPIGRQLALAIVRCIYRHTPQTSSLFLPLCFCVAARLDGLLALTSAAYIASADLKADEALGADKVGAEPLGAEPLLTFKPRVRCACMSALACQSSANEQPTLAAPMCGSLARCTTSGCACGHPAGPSSRSCRPIQPSLCLLRLPCRSGTLRALPTASCWHPPPPPSCLPKMQAQRPRRLLCCSRRQAT